jgi:hypothetical protein
MITLVVGAAVAAPGATPAADAASGTAAPTFEGHKRCAAST